MQRGTTQITQGGGAELQGSPIDQAKQGKQTLNREELEHSHDGLTSKIRLAADHPAESDSLRCRSEGLYRVNRFIRGVAADDTIEARVDEDGVVWFAGEVAAC